MLTILWQGYNMNKFNKMSDVNFSSINHNMSLLILYLILVVNAGGCAYLIEMVLIVKFYG